MPTFRRFFSSTAATVLIGAFVIIAAGWCNRAEADDGSEPSGRDRLLFETHVRPLLKENCSGCHNPKAMKASLDLTSIAGLIKGSESGEVVVAGKPDDSLLYQMLDEGLMPPEGSSKSLTETQVAVVRRWIETGAESKNKKVLALAERVTQHDVIPIMNLRCTVCHGLREKKGKLDLRTRESMLKGGESGPAIVPGKPEESLILKRIHAREMPPPKLLVDYGVRPVEPAELETLTKWIAQGAPVVQVEPDVATTEPDPLVTDGDRRFWAFQPPVRPEVPEIAQASRRRKPTDADPEAHASGSPAVRNPIDAFLLRRLQQKDLSFSPEADRLTLIRRVAFDLTGLPPTWQEVERFLSDDSPNAYEKMVDRYLASKHYGERWGQYWLDLAGYADSEGKRSADPVRPHAWRYRDYVIRAFNDDKPYDRFLLEQIAGDELADYENAETITPELYDNLVATAFLRMAPDGTGSDIVNTAVERMEVIADELNIFGSGVLGLTIKCAQCHSHKYDPIPQRDYYRLKAVFQGAYDEYDWLKPSFVAGQTKSKKPGRVLSYVTAEERRQWEAEERRIDREIARFKERLEAERNELSEKDFKKFEKKIDREIEELKEQIPPQPQIRALWDRGVPSNTYIYQRGQVTNPGELVGPGVPTVLTDGRTPFEAEPPWPGSKKTGRRLALAKWLIQPDHPLTARVMVNRIWRFHFGRGIVKTLGNFGHTGARPTHPELLDWLAREFITRGWSIKQMHRLMMTSTAYRQVSHLRGAFRGRAGFNPPDSPVKTGSTFRGAGFNPPDGPVKTGPTSSRDAFRLDPENKLFSRMPLRRMEAEVVRDSLLFVAGKLDERQFGKPDPVDARDDGLVTSKQGERGWRRSIYVMHRRKEMPTILESFDRPQMIPNCIERPTSTVASQALHLMNDAMIRKLATAFAERIETEAGDEPYRQVERTYQLALSRMPTDEEKQVSLQALEDLTDEWHRQLGGESDQLAEAESRALANFCHAVLNSAAFLYID